MRAATTLFLGLAFAVAGCASVKEAVNGPQLSPIAGPTLTAAMVGGAPTIIASAQSAQQGPIQGATANSLWRPGARAFFIDQRANRVGDILTVAITIDDSARLQNTTDVSRQNATKGGVTNFFGLEQSLGKIFPAGFDPANMINQSGSTASTGQGTVARQEKIQLTIAAIVTGVLPNGNLVIQGRQEVRANNELRELLISGIVRPEDISSANVIKHTQIAEARISYGGRGDLTRVARTPAGQALAQQYSPF
ncbi:MAG TPA: flagellar basal body L-ring protein FlgH [Caulobacteraceae bacterium]|jgi:flagellar L-ring protein precursor FlgH